MDQRLDKSSVHMWFNSHTFDSADAATQSFPLRLYLALWLGWDQQRYVYLFLIGQQRFGSYFVPVTLLSSQDTEITLNACASCERERRVGRSCILPHWLSFAVCERRAKGNKPTFVYSKGRKRRRCRQRERSTTFCALVGPECRISWGD